VVLSVLTFWLTQSFTKSASDFQKKQMDTQATFQKMQSDINMGGQLSQIYNNMVHDMAAASYDNATGKLKDENLKNLLTKYGITVQVQMPASTPKPNNQ
jgi:hypothetical protein